MIIGFILTAVIVAICIRTIDKPVAIFINKWLFNDSMWHRVTSDIPDTLLIMVCIITIFAFVSYHSRKNKGIYNADTMFFRLIMYAMPASYIVKSLLKFAFGRITTREWLIRPESCDFHWFCGGGSYDGFPSGHMMVFTALAMSLWRFYPRYRAIYSVFLLILALSLIATNYHFLSDVIAGAYVGAILEVCTYHLLARERQG